MNDFKPTTPAPEHPRRDVHPGEARPTLYEWKDAVIDDESLSPTLKCTLLVLTRWMDQHGRCWPSRTTIAAKLGVTKRTAQRNLTEAESLGWISRDEEQPIILHACFPTPTTTENAPENAPNSPDEGMTLMTKNGHQCHGGVTSVTQKRSPVSWGGDICDTKTVTSVTRTTQELPKEPSNELSSCGGGANSAQSSTPPTPDDHHNHPPQAQTIREMADHFGVAVYPGTEAELWHQTLADIGNPDDALCFIRDKFQQWRGKDINARGVLLWLHRDAPEWLEMHANRRGSATPPALKTNATVEATEPQDGITETIWQPPSVEATPEQRAAAEQAWELVREHMPSVINPANLHWFTATEGYRLAAGELVVGSEDPFATIWLRDNYADLIPMDKLSAEFGVERITWLVPGEVEL